MRGIEVAAAYGGAPCFEFSQTQACNIQQCDRACVVSPWSNWADCNQKCNGGTQARTRTVQVQPIGKGAPCPELTETQACNAFSCPIDCAVSDWSMWTACTATCGGGTQKQQRSVSTPAAHGGKACPILEQVRACNEAACPLWQAGEWSVCDKACGRGSQTRVVTCVAASQSSSECDQTNKPLERMDCNTHECEKPCILSDFSDWSVCSAECGGGMQHQLRVVLQQPNALGKPCDSLVNMRTCNTNPCPVDCIVSSWSAWSRCDKDCNGGLQKQTRYVIRESANGGKQCPPLSQEQPCNSQPCPVPCKVGDFGPWSECSVKCGGGGIQERQRAIITPAANGGTPCLPLMENQQCGNTPCPRDCEVSPFGAWDECSSPCTRPGTEPGTQVSRRRITVYPAYGGAACPALTQTRPCNTQTCDQPCQVGQWTAWSQCSEPCGLGVQTRTRTVVVPPLMRGAACPSLTETQACTIKGCPVDCAVSAWSEWSRCSADLCGAGRRSQTRTVLVAAAFGGQECPSLYNEADCVGRNGPDCEVPCVVSAWSRWSACSTT